MQKVIAANWKMFKTPSEAGNYVKTLNSLLDANPPADRQVILFPGAINLSAVQSESEKGGKHFQIGIQNFCAAEDGAYTGENSLNAAKTLDVTWVLAGHSERRTHFLETDELIANKVKFAMEKGFGVILCIGETDAERTAGKVEQVLKEQLTKALINVPGEYDVNRLVIAYEPVWAIGTGKTPSNDDIKKTHNYIHKVLDDLMPNKAPQTRIIYGGSVTADKAKNILQTEDVSGLLVGGASLKAEDFNTIIRS